MKKSLKLLVTILLAVVLVMSCSQYVMAAESISPSGVIGEIQPTTTGAETGTLTALAGRVIGLIQIASAVLAVVLIAVFGFKFIMGSANEKADYQKSFIPLIVGVVVVFSATSIAKLLFSLLGNS